MFLNLKYLKIWNFEIKRTENWEIEKKKNNNIRNN